MMNLQVFVSETLVQLIVGVKNAQEKVKEHKARIAPDGIKGGTSTRSGHPTADVEFDVAVTVTEDSEKKGAGGISIAGLTIGGSGQSSTTNSIVSRIKFSVPIGWTLD